MNQTRFGKDGNGHNAFRALLVTALGISLVSGISARAEAQTYQLKNIGVITGAAFSTPVAMDDTGSVIRVIGTSRDKFGNTLNCWYWDTSRTEGSPLSIGPGTPYDVNSLGEVVGRGPQVAGQQDAFFWKEGVYTKLPWPSTTPDGAAPFIDAHARSGHARAINEAGVIYGNVYREDLGVLNVVWQMVGGVWQVQYLKLLPGGPSTPTNGSSGGGINEAGDIAGSVVSRTQGDALRAVVWKNLGTPASPEYGDPTDSGLPAESDWTNSGGSFINNSVAGAQVMGGYDGASSVFHRFVWIPGSAPVSFEAAGTNGFSDDGAVTGWTYAFAGGAQRAYYYKDGTLSDCGSLGSGSSYGYGLNNAGEVVGLSKTTPNSATYAFIWKAGVMKNLGNLVTGGLGPTFSRLTNARKIGNGGAITGEGITKKGGYSQAYVLRRMSP